VRVVAAVAEEELHMDERVDAVDEDAADEASLLGSSLGMEVVVVLARYHRANLVNRVANLEAVDHYLELLRILLVHCSYHREHHADGLRQAVDSTGFH